MLPGTYAIPTFLSFPIICSTGSLKPSFCMNQVNYVPEECACKDNGPFLKPPLNFMKKVTISKQLIICVLFLIFKRHLYIIK